MTGVTCEAGNAHSSRTPDFTLQWRVHVVPFLFTNFADVQTRVLFVNDFGFVCFLYGLTLMLMNILFG